MKLRNKKTGEIVDLYEGLIRDDGEHITIKPVAILEKCYIYNSLAELNEEWKDYEETKEYWHIDLDGCLMQTSDIKCDKYVFDKLKEIGNYFDTREEAVQAVEKLKAVKRLKDKGFRFELWDSDGGNYNERINTGRILFRVSDSVDGKDLDICFGGEE